MCKLTHSSPQPPSTDTLDTSTGPVTFQNQQPDAVKDTKFKKLLQVVLPIAQGGLVGGFGGDWRVPGSGFRAAQSYFGQQADLAMRQKEQQQQLANAKSENVYRAAQTDFDQAKTQHELQIPPFASSAGRTWTSDVDGEKHRFRVNPYTGNPEDLGKDTPANRLGLVHAGSKYYGVQETGPQAGTATPITVAPGTGTSPGMSIDEKRRMSAAQLANPQPAEPPEPGEVPDRPPGTAMGGGWRTPIGQEQQPPTGPPMELTDDSDARRKLPKPRPVTDSDARGVSTTHFVDANPESPTYMQDVAGGKPAATRQPKPSKVMAKPKVEDVEALAQEALKQESGDQAKAIDRINRAQIPDGVKSFVRQRIREIRRPGPKQNILDRYGITAGDVGKLTQK